MNFLEKELIFSSMSEIAEGLSTIYGLDAKLYVEEGDTHMWLGYQFFYKEDLVKVYMPYLKNDKGEIAKNAVSWAIETKNGTNMNTMHRTLGDVLTSLKITKKMNTQK